MYTCDCGNGEFVEAKVITLAGAPAEWETLQAIPRTVAYRLICTKCHKTQTLVDRERYIRELIGPEPDPLPKPAPPTNPLQEFAANGTKGDTHKRIARAQNRSGRPPTNRGKSKSKSPARAGKGI